MEEHFPDTHGVRTPDGSSSRSGELPHELLLMLCLVHSDDMHGIMESVGYISSDHEQEIHIRVCHVRRSTLSTVRALIVLYVLVLDVTGVFDLTVLPVRGKTVAHVVEVIVAYHVLIRMHVISVDELTVRCLSVPEKTVSVREVIVSVRVQDVPVNDRAVTVLDQDVGQCVGTE